MSAMRAEGADGVMLRRCVSPILEAVRCVTSCGLAADGGIYDERMVPSTWFGTSTAVTDGIPAAEGDNTSASATDDAEASCQVSDFDVWFKYTATCTGLATIDTSGSGQEDTVLAAYGVCGGSEIACNDDAQGSTLAQITFAVTEGQAYHIRLASFAPPGDYDLNITCAAPCLDAAECDDGLFCNGEEDCAEGTCSPDLAPCGETLCSEELDACVDCLDDSHCNDNDACTLDVCDPDTGGCTHDAVVCDDEDACTADSCEPATGCIYSPIDTDEDGTPDCEDPCPIDNPDDTDGDGVCDSDDICAGGDDNLDEDEDGVPDFCDPCPQDNSDDTDGDGVCDSADNCELFNPDQLDCQSNGVGDVCDLDDGTSQDCNENAIPDECDISEGTSDDCGANGTPDECEICVGDLNCDDTSGAADLAILLGSWGPCPNPCPSDIAGDGDGMVGADDLATLLGNWGSCD